jgi:hypothetical protein
VSALPPQNNSLVSGTSALTANVSHRERGFLCEREHIGTMIATMRPFEQLESSIHKCGCLQGLRK